MSEMWIKMGVNLGIKEEVVRMRFRLGCDAQTVVGRLHAVWSWVDGNSMDGRDLKIPCCFVDELAGCSGFADAMREVGWMEGRDGCLSFPNFSRHNGQTAKNRAMTSARVDRMRNGKSVTSNDCVCNADTVTKALPDKIREEVIPPPTPPQAGGSGDDGQIVNEEKVLLLKVLNLFGCQEVRVLDRNEFRSWCDNIEKVRQTTEEGWNALLRWYELPRENARGRRDKLSTLLTHWNGEVERAMGYLKSKKTTDADRLPEMSCEERHRRDNEIATVKVEKLRKRLNDDKKFSMLEVLDVRDELRWFNGSLPEDVRLLLEAREKAEGVHIFGEVVYETK